MSLKGEEALILGMNYTEESLLGAGALKGQDGFSPVIKENENNSDTEYRLDIETKEETFTTPNLMGTGGATSFVVTCDLATNTEEMEISNISELFDNIYKACVDGKIVELKAYVDNTKTSYYSLIPSTVLEEQIMFSMYQPSNENSNIGLSVIITSEDTYSVIFNEMEIQDTSEFQKAIHGEEGQFVGFDAEGNPIAVDAPILDATDVSYDENDTVKTKIDGLINDETASEDTVYSGKKINSLTGVTSPTSLGKRLRSTTIASNYSYNSYNYGAKLTSFNTSSFKKITFRHSYAAIKGSSGSSNVFIIEPGQSSNYMYVSHLESSEIRDVEIDCTKLKPDTTYELRFSAGGTGQFVMHLITDIKGWSETDVSDLKTGIEEAKTYGIGSVSQLFACMSGDALFSEGYVSGAGMSELGTIDLTPYRKITYNNFTSGGGSINIRDASGNIIRNTVNAPYGTAARCEIDVTDLYGEYKVVIGTSATIIVTDVKGIKYTEDIPTNLTDAIFYLAKKIAEGGG